MENKINLLKKMLYLFVMLFFACLMIYLGIRVINSTRKFEYIELDNGWNVTVNEQEMRNGALSSITFDIVEKGTTLELSTVLPDESIEHPTLVFRLYHCIIDGVYLDNECIYQYGQELAENNRAVGTGNFIINLPRDYMNKKIKMNLTVQEDNAFNYIETMSIYNQLDYMSIHIRKMSLEFFVGVFQIMFGIIVVFLLIYLGKISEGYRKLLWIGIISLGSGMWTVCYNNISEFFMENRGLMTYFEHIGLYSVVPAICMFYSESTKSKIPKKIMHILGIFGFVFMFFSTSMQIFNVKHASEYLVIFHIYAGVFCVTMLGVVFVGFKEKPKSEKIICIGTVLLVLGGTIALISYNIVKFADEGIRQSLNVLPIATISFITIMMMSYIEYLKEMVEESIDKKVLLKMAYNDILTGLPNRGKCDNTIKELADEKRDNYAIICFDLNNLKVINDTKGHLKGDTYICSFANILNYSFGEYGTVGRMGGDEFIAIINDTTDFDLDKAISEMVKIAEANEDSKGRKFPISFAYGYAQGNENEGISVEKAYELADMRMYECKKNQKLGRE